MVRYITLLALGIEKLSSKLLISGIERPWANSTSLLMRIDHVKDRPDIVRQLKRWFLSHNGMNTQSVDNITPKVTK